MTVSLSQTSAAEHAAAVEAREAEARRELLNLRREDARRRATLGLKRGLLDEWQVWGICQAAARETVRTASDSERDALASELAERMFRRAGVEGPRGTRMVASGIVSRPVLLLLARAIARDSQRWRDCAGESLDETAKRERREAGEDRRGFLTVEEAEAAGLLVSQAVREDAQVAPLADHLDRLAEAVARELAEAPGERRCIRAAVLQASGASPLAISVAEGVTEGAIRKRAERGRLLIAMQDVTEVAALIARLADALNLRAYPPADHPQISAEAHGAREWVEAAKVRETGKGREPMRGGRGGPITRRRSARPPAAWHGRGLWQAQLVGALSDARFGRSVT